MLSISNLDPPEIGLPESFAQFRDCQVEAVEEFLNLDRRFYGCGLPTGSGKSLAALAFAKASGMRTAIVTATKGLQQQYIKEFGSCGLIDIRGKSNYQCDSIMGANCRSGPHEGCMTCTCYEEARQRAKSAQIVLTNYPYWVRINERAGGLQNSRKDQAIRGTEDNPFELLILDEGHMAVEELSKCLQVNIRESWLRAAGIDYMKSCGDPSEWNAYAWERGVEVEVLLAEAITDLKQRATPAKRDRVYQLEELSEALSKLTEIIPTEWVCEQRVGTNHGRIWSFDCIWPAQFAEKRLFAGIPNVVFMSATLRPIVMRMLGIHTDDFLMHEWPRVFPAKNSPVYHVPTVRLSYRSPPEDTNKWLTQIDKIIGANLNAKGIIHTVSYERQRYLLEKSRYAKHFIINSSDPDTPRASEIVQAFKASVAPSVLVSPSFSTGWDFPGDDCRWQIIAKIAFPDTRSKVMQTRKERNPRYINYLAMQQLVQAANRGTRSYDDTCTTYIVDDNIGWFMQQNKSLAPSWFTVQKRSNISS